MSVHSFDEACRFLFRRTAGGIKWGLETTERLAAALGNPHRHFATVHIAGTNGKGSTAAFLSSMLRAQGFRTGLYTSPHLVSFTERMQVDGRPVTEEAVATWVRALEPVAEETGASFFEITTAVAFADFAARGVEIAVIEVGLGGRLDATNIIVPLACGVTRIALEHTDYLGSDILGIGREKAGIAKPGVPFLTTEQDPEVLGAMRQTVEGRKSKVEPVKTDLAAAYRLGLGGPHQAANASLATALARRLPPPFAVDESSIAAGLASARVPGRFDRRGAWLFDVAHNPDGVRALLASLAADPPPRPLVAVVAILKDKAWREMLDLLAPAVDRMILTRAPSAPAERGWDLEDVRRERREERGKVETEPELAKALQRAREAGGTALVTGSFHTVGDSMSILGIDPLA